MAKMYSEIQLDLEIKGYIAALEKAKQANAKLKSDYQKKIDGMNKKNDALMSSFKKMAGVIGAAFATQRIIAFGKEAIILAAKAEGIKDAFDKLNNYTLLDNLRKATRGTVDDVTLMARAVQSNNFRISLENLPTYFEFAQQRARATGESVDYLVDSIVRGIGRKSALILDNLGISLSELNEQLKLTPDYADAVGAIISREMAKSGTYIETTADKLDQLKTAMTNLKVEVGDIFNDVLAKPLAESAKSLSDVISGISELRRELDLGGVNKEVANQIRGNIAAGSGTAAGHLMSMLLGGRKAGKNEIIITAGTPITKTAPQAATSGEAVEEAINYRKLQGEATALSWAQVEAAMAVTDQAHRQAEALALINPQLEANLAAYDAQVLKMQELTSMVQGMEGAISSLFRSGMEGWESFGETAKNIMKELMVKLLTLITLYTILNILSGGTFSMSGLGNYISQGFGVTPKVGGGGGPVGMGGGTSVLKGRDIVLSAERSGGVIFKNT